MSEFKPTPSKMRCNKIDECQVKNCNGRIPHKRDVYCNYNCDGENGIPESRCVLIPLTGAELIADERRRQVEVEGWTPERDVEVHKDGGLVLASMCYIMDYYGHLDSTAFRSFCCEFARESWPWDFKWWKPSTPNDSIKQLVKAGALISAEIDRLQKVSDGK